jgi:eukaryotic-like serine/threonine-protein kinase
MDPKRWLQVKEILAATIQRPRHERAAFLAAACSDDEALYLEVKSLLDSYESTFLEEPAVGEFVERLASPQPQVTPGQCISHYRIVSLLAVSGMGEVYLGRDTKLGRKVALKFFPTHLTWDEDKLRRFEQEARAASALNHPNILTVYEIGEVVKHQFIVTEFVEGETLRKHLATVRMSIDEVRDVATQIVSALAAAHAAGIVHRDIKPENIMIRPDGYVKVLDFGLAKLVEKKNQSFLGLEESTGKQNQTAAGLICGTVNYMSPEQAKGEQIDERTDIFSLGVVIYETITGRTPFAEDSMSETFANLINAEPQPLSRLAANVPQELTRIVSKMLRKNKEERYQTMNDIFTDLKDLRVGPILGESLASSHSPNSGTATDVLSARTRDVDKQTPKAQYSFSHRIARHKSLAALALAAVLVGTIGLGYYFIYPRRTASSVGDKKSIAILPLKPINTANRDEIYEIGIADSLILKLNSMKGFVVRPLSATRKYSAIAQDPLAAGREQQVDYVLVSNYQLAGGKIRVTAQLLNVASGQIDETYKSEKEAADVFAMQDEIASEVGNGLSARFATTAGRPSAKRGTTNEDAYRLYLQGMYLYDKRTPADAQNAVEVLEQAVKLDPNYALAWAGKAHAYRSLANFFHSSRNANAIQDEYQKSMEAINRALALDESLPDAHSALCENKMYYEYDFAGAERECKRAIELDPNSSLAHQIYSRYLLVLGRLDDAVAEIKIAIDIEPASLFSQRNYGVALYYARRFPEAVVQLKRVIAMNPSFGSTYIWLWNSLNQEGNSSEAFEWFMKYQAQRKTDEGSVYLFKKAYETSGWRGVSREELRKGENNHLEFADLAYLNIQLGNKDKAFEYLEKSYQRREVWVAYLQVEPQLDSLRGDPRFDVMLKRVGLK